LCRNAADKITTSVGYMNRISRPSPAEMYWRPRKSTKLEK